MIDPDFLVVYTWLHESKDAPTIPPPSPREVFLRKFLLERSLLFFINP